MMNVFRPGGRALTIAAATVAATQMTWMQAHAADEPLSGGESEVERAEDEEPIEAETKDVVGGGEDLVTAAPSPTTISDSLEADKNAEALILVTTSPPVEPLATPLVAPTGKEGEEAMENLQEDAPVEIAGGNSDGKNETPAPTQVLQTTAPVATESVAPIEQLPETTEPAATPETTNKPSLRTQDPVVISDAVTNDAAKSHSPGYLDQSSNPLLLVVLAGICCVFLFVWGRKRRLGGSSIASGGNSSKGPKVEYSQVPDEQPFSHSQDDDDEYCDDYEEDTFANDRDNWDDWEGSSPQVQESQLNPFASPPRSTTPYQARNPFQPTQPLSPPPTPHQEHTPLEIAGASKDGTLPSGVESNSSSDSFEVVSDEVSIPPSSSHGADVEKESESVDDLFSQFGMVPTFKKSAVVPPPAPSSSASSASRPAQSPLVSPASSLPTAAQASALFAAELDDELTAVDAADEWGEDDEWVKGI
ncbi:hypothetical protein PHYBOEH_008643 [Phytophthora boehmeriae]|uniref:Uncharacterized protein n=1 Tax=Phytophthora boehmeriae TaxID=109152 RepID=A0A8T1X563_9STRA|nr:hypothetical protein PHYBOEH_008643 [Phytophthora boehmeriae]